MTFTPSEKDADDASVQYYDFQDEATPSEEDADNTSVEYHNYQDENLALNNIYLYPSCDRNFPAHVANLIAHVVRDRASPGPTLDELSENTELMDLGLNSWETEVEQYFREHIFPSYTRKAILKRCSRTPILEKAIPHTPKSGCKVSNPTPSLLYGYNKRGAFPSQPCRAQLASMRSEMIANIAQLLCPFLLVEFQRDAFQGLGSKWWGTTNQCLGGSASCVNITERLHDRLKKWQSNITRRPTDEILQSSNETLQLSYEILQSSEGTHLKNEIPLINTATFSIGMSGSEARLYISWKHNELYYMAQIKSFLLQDPEHYAQFRKYVLNIIDWGQSERLEEIRKSLSILHEEKQKRSSAVTKKPSSAETQSMFADRP